MRKTDISGIIICVTHQEIFPFFWLQHTVYIFSTFLFILYFICVTILHSIWILYYYLYCTLLYLHFANIHTFLPKIYVRTRKVRGLQTSQGGNLHGFNFFDSLHFCVPKYLDAVNVYERGKCLVDFIFTYNINIFKI